MEKVCLICKNEIKEGEKTFDCPECGKTYHHRCWKMTGCCADDECREKTKAKKEKIEAENKIASEHKESTDQKESKQIEIKENIETNQDHTQKTDENKKSKAKKSLIIVAAVIVAYTVLVSSISIGAYRSYLAKSIERAFTSDSVFDETSGDAEKDNKKKQNKSDKISIGQTVTVKDMFEVKIEKSEWKEKIEPSDTTDYYSYIDDVNGEKFFIVWANVKNLSSQEIDLKYQNGKCSAFINGKYNLDGNIIIEGTEKKDFYGTIKPLQEARVAFYVSVPDEMYDNFESAEMYLGFVNNEKAIDNYDATDDDFNNYVIALKNG